MAGGVNLLDHQVQLVLDVVLDEVEVLGRRQQTKQRNRDLLDVFVVPDVEHEEEYRG